MSSKIGRKRKKWLKKQNRYVNPRDTWCLCVLLAEYILPRLKEFKRRTNAYPMSVESMEDWYEIIDRMIYAFDYISKDSITYGLDSWDNDFREKYDEIQKRIDNGLYLFGKYFQELWW